MTGEPNDDDADRLHITEIRKRLGLKQSEMAERLGMGLRAYSDLENGVSKTRPIHVLAAERISLRVATERQDASLAAYSVVQDARAIIRGSNA